MIIALTWTDGSRRRGSVHSTVADAVLFVVKNYPFEPLGFAPTPRRRREWSVYLGDMQVARLRRRQGTGRKATSKPAAGRANRKGK